MMNAAFLSLLSVKKGHYVRRAFVSGALELFLSIPLILVLTQMRFPSFNPDNVDNAVLPLRNQAYGFLIQSSKPNTQGSLISRYYNSPKVAIWPSRSVNIWHVTQK